MAACLSCSRDVFAPKRGLCQACYMRERRAGTLDASFPKLFGKGMPGRPHSEESRAKIGAANKGLTRTTEQRANISKARTGLHVSAEARARLVGTKTGERNAFFGRKHSAETLAKMRGVPKSAESRAKMSAAKKGRPLPPSARTAANVSMLGRSHTATTRLKMSRPHGPYVAGLTYNTYGYALVYMPDHPKASRNGRVLEHVLIAEQMIGRPLTRKEVVHHRNGVKRDNRPENLAVLLRSDHALLHMLLRSKNKARLIELAADDCVPTPVAHFRRYATASGELHFTHADVADT